MQEAARKTQHANKKDFGIYKLRGVNQYILRAHGYEINFIFEEDARRFARKLAGNSDLELILRESPAL